MKEAYIMNEQAPKPLKTRLDTLKTPVRTLTGAREEQDFIRYTKPGVMSQGTISRVPIKPLLPVEKVGPKFGK